MHSSLPDSPTMVLSGIHPSSIATKLHSHLRRSHALSKSISSSVGNISLTTVNFQMLTGSLGGLNLRLEHEHHLGDIPGLDFVDRFKDYL